MRAVGLISIALLLSFGAGKLTLSAQAVPGNGSILVEQTQFDWDHSGNPSAFFLFRSLKGVDEQPDRLVIKQAGKPSWSLTNRDDVWAPLSDTGLSAFRNQKKRLFFVSTGPQSDAHIYLILKGAISGCCVGSLMIVTPDEAGHPKVVFHQSSYEIAAIIPTDGNSLELIGRLSDSEARAWKNAQSYDPYRIYILQNSEMARYDLDLSKAYTESHYCQWHGSEYDEQFVAVGPPNGLGSL